jgi:hypothetical protein
LICCKLGGRKSVDNPDCMVSGFFSEFFFRVKLEHLTSRHFSNCSKESLKNRVFIPPAATLAKFTMQQFIISKSIFLIFVYSYIISSNYLSRQQFSTFKTHQKQLNSPKSHFCPASAQASPENSLPRNKVSPPNNNQRVQKLIPHKQIILFFRHSFAILSIPYLKFKNDTSYFSETT